MKLQLFGAYRRFTPEAEIELALDDAMTVAQLREVLKTYASAHWLDCDPRLIDASAFATAQQVLQNSDTIEPEASIAVLPPVSGG